MVDADTPCQSWEMSAVKPDVRWTGPQPERKLADGLQTRGGKYLLTQWPGGSSKVLKSIVSGNSASSLCQEEIST